MAIHTITAIIDPTAAVMISCFFMFFLIQNLIILYHLFLFSVDPQPFKSPAARPIHNPEVTGIPKV